jgi:hypothetical protein
MLAPQPGNQPAYDICFSVNGGHFFRKLDRAVTLSDDRIAWTADGCADQMPFGNIVAVHLQSSGQYVLVDRCTVAFADGNVLSVVNSAPGGFADQKRVSIYRDFVRDLHARLAAGHYCEIRFTAGVPRWRYQGMLALTIVAALFCAVIGLVALVAFGNFIGLGILIVGGFSIWKLGRTTLANAPRDYMPGYIPEKLLS